MRAAQLDKFVTREQAADQHGGAWLLIKAIIRDRTLTGGEARFLQLLMDVQGPDLKTFPGRTWLAKHLGFQPTTVARYLAALKAKGRIKMVAGKHRRQWQFCIPKLIQGASKCGASVDPNAPQNVAPKAPQNVAPKAPQNVAPDVTRRNKDVKADFEANGPEGCNRGSKAKDGSRKCSRAKATAEAKRMTAAESLAEIPKVKAAGDRQRRSGDTMLVHTLNTLLGNGRVNHATWCKLDRALCRGVSRKTREDITATVTQMAKTVISDNADNPAAAFMAKVKMRFSIDH